jgi:hypothetical protein
MSVPVPCPTCGTVLLAPPGSAGRKARCRKCEAKFRIPGVAEAEPAVVDESLMLSAFDFSVDLGTDPAKSNPTIGSGTGYKPRQATGGAGKIVFLIAGLLIALLAVAGGGLFWWKNANLPAEAKVSPDRPKVQRPTEEPKAKPSGESAKRSRGQDRPRPVDETPVDPTADKRTRKDAPPRPVRIAGPKLPPAPADDAKPISAAATVIALPYDPGQVQSVMVNASATRLAVVRLTFAGFQGKGAIRTVDVHTYPSATLLATIEVPSDVPEAPITLGREDGLLVAETQPGAVTAWKAGNGKKVIDQASVVPAAGARSMLVGFVPGDESLLAIGPNGTIYRVAVEGAKVTTAFEPKGVLSPSFTAARNRNVVVPADGKLAAYGDGSTIVVASLTGGTARVEWTSPHKVDQWRALAVDAGGNRIAGVALDAGGTAWIQVGRFGEAKAIVNAVLPGESGEVTGLHWYGETVAVRTDANLMILYDCETGGFIGSCRLPPSPIRSATIPGGDRLIAVVPREAKSFALIDAEFPFDGYFSLRDRAADDRQPVSLRFGPSGFVK